MRHFAIACAVFMGGLLAGRVAAADYTERKFNPATATDYDQRVIGNQDGVYMPAVVPFQPNSYGRAYVAVSTRATVLLPVSVTLNGVGFDWDIMVAGPANSSGTFIVNGSSPIVIIAGEPGWMSGNFGALGSTPTISITNLTSGATAQAVIKGAR